MKILKVLFTSMALLAFGGTMVFADATSVVTADGSEFDTNDTYAGSTTDVEGISPPLAVEWSASSHGIDLYADVATISLVPFLYYNGTNVDDYEALYDEDWDLTAGFTTAEFSIGLNGTASSAENLQVTVAATPFALYDSEGTVHTAGAMTVNHVEVTETLSDTTESTSSVVDGSIATSTEVSSPTAFTIQSVDILNTILYVSTTPVVSFTLNTAEPSDTLLAGRYKSTVTLTYEIV